MLELTVFLQVLLKLLQQVALQALDWLERSGIQNAETIYKRVRKIRKQQQITMRNMGE